VPKQILVVGLGQFGMALARALSRRRVEVLGVDARAELVEQAAEFAAHAVQFDATDEADLAGTEPARRDVCVCAIGNEARDASIVCTALLRQLGARRVIARATDPLHERILLLVGAHEVVSPERAFGDRLAARLAFRGVQEQFPIGPDLLITEVDVPEALVGKTLRQLDLRGRFDINVVAVRRRRDGGEEVVELPRPDEPLSAADLLVLVGTHENTESMLRRL